MEELLLFLKKYEVWVYVLSALIGLVYLRKLVIAYQDWRASLFGMERESAQRRFSTYLSLFLLVILTAGLEVSLVSFVIPNYPVKQGLLPTPTLDLNITPTQPLPAGTPGAAVPAGANQTQQPTVVVKLTEGCTKGAVEWSFPKVGDEIGGKVDLLGTVNIPNLGFYKYEYSQPGTDVWSTIAAGNKNIVNDLLGRWDTTLLVPGDYLLRLVVADNQNQLLPACVVSVRVVAPTPVP
jgi:hypothetical protein